MKLPELAARTEAIRPFYVMEVQRRAAELEAQGRAIVHMEIGQPDFPAPPQVYAAAHHALDSIPLDYSGALGIRPLREAIARYYGTRHRIDVSPERIVVTAGASGAFVIALGALINPGDEVLMADPGYPCNRGLVHLFDGCVRTIPVDADSDFQLRATDIEAHWTPQTRGVLIASPANPTGTLIDPQELAAIAAIVDARGGFLLVDEIYHGLIYRDHYPTALTISDRILVINSFSKYFCMTGWRLGWLVAPPEYVPAMERLSQNAFICVSVPAQYAALAAFQADTLQILEERRKEFERRRDFLLPALEALGFKVQARPEGAFYVYADCSAFSADSHRFAFDLLEQAGVAVTPGCDFGEHRAERHLRFAYTRDLVMLEEGMRRLKDYLGR